MKIIAIALLLSYTFAYAAEPLAINQQDKEVAVVKIEQAKDRELTNIYDLWTFGAGYVKGPINSDGSIFTIGTPSLWSKYISVRGVSDLTAKYNMNVLFNWESLFAKNILTDESGNFEGRSFELYSLITRWSLLFNNETAGFLELGYGFVSGANRFTSKKVEGVIMGFGSMAGAATVKLNYFLTTDVAEKVPSQPDVFFGTYLSLGFNFGLNALK